MFYTKSPQARPGGFYSPRPGFLKRLLRGALWTVATIGALAGTTHLLLDPPAALLQTPEQAKVEYLTLNLGAARGRLPDAAMRKRIEQDFDAL